MSELVGALRDFLRRDLALLLGGAVAVGAFLHAFGRLAQFVESLDGLVVALFATGLSYVVGFALQAMSEMVGVIRTEPPRVLLSWERKLYHRLTGKMWANVPAHVAFTDVWARLGEDGKRLVERTIFLKMIGAAVGPASVLAGAMLFTRWIASEPRPAFDLTLSILAVVFGIILIAVSRVKAAQQAKLYEEWRQSDA